MEEYHEILARSLAEELLTTTLPALLKDHELRTERICYKALKDIRLCLEDDKIDDEHCFRMIEKIINHLEEIGVFVANRHDFG